MLKNSSILITRGTGSFRRAFVPLTSEKYTLRKLIAFSRDGVKQWELVKPHRNDSRARFFVDELESRYQKIKHYEGLVQ